jgi:UDP-N-acetylmuramoyl-tripeptide--D-alanyl-D-alanine ligase
MNIEALYSIYKKHPVVCTDSRAITDGCIFFALKGDNFNGNIFAEDALKKGASYVVIDEEKYKTDNRTILVDDVLKTLQLLANHNRRQLKCKVLAITGSNGKTTTKELIATVLSKKYKTHFTKGNFNNHIGVPLTILSAAENVEMLIVEMGANHLKEIEMLCNIAEPEFGIITNVGKAHLEGFGSLDGVKKAKGELYDFLSAHKGLAFVNGDNEKLSSMIAERNVNRIIKYGSKFDCECEGKILESFPFVKLKWKYDLQQGEISTQLIGNYNFENILAAICIGNYFEVEAEKIISAIAEYTPANNRSQILQKGTNTIILDAYNANPSSMEVALKNFSELKGNNKIIFLGEMSELGEQSSDEHRTLIKQLKLLNFPKVILVGKKFIEHQKLFSAEYFSTSAEATDWLKKNLPQHSTILIKGSRSTKMEVVLDGF